MTGVGDVISEVDFQVDVYGAPMIPARVDSGEFGDALFIGQLYAAQEARSIGLP